MAFVVVKEILLIAIGHEEIQQAVVVIITPCTSLRSAAIGHDASGSDSRKCAVTIVVITPRAAIRSATVVDDASGGNFRQRSVAVIAIEKIILALLVRDKEIQIAIVVVIAPGAPA